MRLSLLDTTLLSNFAHAGRPDWVRVALADTAVTTAAVLAELRQGEIAGLVPNVDWAWLPRVTLTPAEAALATSYRNMIDAGEAECLAVAVARDGRFLTDDLAARRLAQANGVTVSGTIGVLLRLIQQQHLTILAADALLTRMRGAGYRAPVASLQTYLEET